MSNSIALSNNNIELRVEFSQEIVNLEKDYGKNSDDDICFTFLILVHRHSNQKTEYALEKGKKLLKWLLMTKKSRGQKIVFCFVV